LGVLRVRHGARLVREFAGYAAVNRAWWVLPVMLLLVVSALLIAAGQAAAPYSLYTVF
jgi:hypothetical protein